MRCGVRDQPNHCILNSASCPHGATAEAPVRCSLASRINQIGIIEAKGYVASDEDGRSCVMAPK